MCILLNVGGFKEWESPNNWLGGEIPTLHWESPTTKKKLVQEKRKYLWKVHEGRRVHYLGAFLDAKERLKSEDCSAERGLLAQAGEGSKKKKLQAFEKRIPAKLKSTLVSESIRIDARLASWKLFFKELKGKKRQKRDR